MLKRELHCSVGEISADVGTKVYQAHLRHSVKFLSLLALGSTLLGRSFTAAVVAPFDSSLFAYFGSQWAHGRTPYLQLWDNKPPGIFALDAIVFSFFPGSFKALAFAEGICILGCVATVYFLLRRWGAPSLVACLAAGAAAIGCNLQAFNEFGNLTEIYVLWPAALSVFCFTLNADELNLPYVFAAGFFSGIAFLFKTVGLAPLLAQLAFLGILTVSQRIRPMRAFRAAALDISGAIAATLPFVFYFWKHDALAKMIDASFLYNVGYGMASQQPRLAEPLFIMVRILPVGSLVLCFLAGLVWFLHDSSRVRLHPRVRFQKFNFYGSLTILWLLADLSGVIAGGRNYGHYYLCLIPSLSIAAGLGFWFMVEKTAEETQGSVMSLLIFTFILGPLLFFQAQDLLLLRDVLHHQSTDATLAYATPEHAVAQYLNRVREPGDTLFTWNYLPMIYLETEMTAPTAVLDAHYLADSKRARDTFEPEIFAELEGASPRFIVDGTSNPEDFTSKPPYYARFHNFIEKFYKLSYLAPSSDLRVYERSAGRPNREGEGTERARSLQQIHRSIPRVTASASARVRGQ